MIIMPSQHVVAEVILQIPPDTVNVIRVVLGVVVFHEEGWALDSIVVALAGF